MQLHELVEAVVGVVGVWLSLCFLGFRLLLVLGIADGNEA